MSATITNKGEDLEQLSYKQPIFLVFLRHFGCTFCMETVSDLAKQKQKIDAVGYKIVFVHLSPDDAKAQAFFTRYGMENESRISDPSGTLYETFEVKKGNIWQLLGPYVLWRFLVAGILKGFGVSKIQGDVTMLPGTFIFHKGKIVSAFRANSSADKTHIAAMESCELI